MLKKEDSIIYNAKQNAVIQEGYRIVDLLDYQRNELGVFGYAGTGKTTCIKEIIKYALNAHDVTLMCIAPTHQAKLVMMQTYGLSETKVNTIHSCFGIRPKQSHTLRQEDLTFDIKNTNVKKLKRNGLLIIDEISMIDEQIFNAIRKEAVKKNLSIIWIGDIGQLRPVSSNTTSIVFKNIDNTIELVEVVRQGLNNPLTLIANKIRNEGKHKFNLQETHLTDDDRGVIICRRDDAIQLIKDNLYNPDFRIATYTNAKVEEINMLYRELKGFDDIINLNERLIATSNWGFNKDDGYILTNGQEFEVLNIEETTMLYGLHEPLNIEKGQLKDTYHSPKNFVELSVLNIKTILNNEIVEMKVMIDKESLDIVTRDLLTIAYDSTDISYYAKKKVFVSNSKLRSDILKALASEKQSKTNMFLTFNPLKIDGRGITWTLKEKNVQYLPTTTIHKTQGITCETMMLNISDFNIDHPEAQELLYVGATRPTKKLIITKL